MSDGNKLYLEDAPDEIQLAQTVTHNYYVKLCQSDTPRTWTRAAAYLHNDAAASLILKGPDTLIKSAIMSAINAYIYMGDALLSQHLTKMNISVPINVLKDVKGIDLDKLERYIQEGHKQVIITVKRMPT